jgi:P27 family predicted phage terminase small subunit
LEEATRTLDRDGRIVKLPILNAGGEVIGERMRAHPAVRMQVDAMTKIKAFLSEFGFSPASRPRLAGAAVVMEKVDPAKAFLSRA